MKKILLIGDSIRMNYMPVVAKNLYGIAEVYGPEENCRFAKYTLCNINDWLRLPGTEPDIIHWNNGIWDITRFNGTDCLTSVSHYLEDMSRILKELRTTHARIIFATTTPVDDQNPVQSNIDIDRLNRNIVPYMREQGIEINDLNAFVRPHIDTYIAEDHVHLTKEGMKQVGGEVTRVLSQYL